MSMFFQKIYTITKAITLVFFLIISHRSNAIATTFKDIQILAQNKDFTEFFLQAKKIAPSARDKAWKELVQKTAKNFYLFLKKSPLITKNQAKLLLQINSWSNLRTTSETLHQNNLLLQKFFLQQLSHPPLTLNEKALLKEQIQSFWQLNQQEFSIGVKLAKKIHQKSIPQLQDLIPILFQSAFLSPLSNIYCEGDLAQKILWEKLKKLEQEFSDLMTSDFNIQISKFMNQKCWQALHPKIFSLLQKKAGPDKLSAHRFVYMASDIALEKKYYSAAIYLLDTPRPSELFNIHWAMIQNLEKKPELRLQVLQHFKKLPFFPDKLFSTSKKQKIIQIAKLFTQSFPEVIDLYLLQCRSYLQGRKTYPQGNPTMHCKDFYQKTQNYNYISPADKELFSRSFPALKSAQ